MTSDDLPDWAVKPLNMNQAAEALGISRRKLTDVLRDYAWQSDEPLYEMQGNRKLFYPEHIAAIRATRIRQTEGDWQRRGGKQSKSSSKARRKEYDKVFAQVVAAAKK